MGIVGTILLIAILGFALWLLVTYVPMHAAAKAVIYFIAIIGLILLVLNLFGISTGIRSPRL